MDNETARFLACSWVLAFTILSMVVTEMFREQLEEWYGGASILGTLIILLYMVVWVTIIAGGAQVFYYRILLPRVIRNGGK